MLGALFTGCRYGESIRLCVEDFRNGAVHIQEAKSGKARVVFVNDEATRSRSWPLRPAKEAVLQPALRPLAPGRPPPARIGLGL